MVEKKNMKKKTNSPSCVICNTEVDPTSAFAFYFNDDIFYFCDNHVDSFKMGVALGQIEINSKTLSYIRDLPDPVNKKDLSVAFSQISPMSDLRQQSKPQNQQVNVVKTAETPRELYDRLDQVVIGQDLAKKAVSVSVINHLISSEASGDDVQTGKHHVLLLGPSGVGKTLTVETIADVLNLPYAAGDATSYSPTGFQGQDAESVIYDLLIETDLDKELAEKGIVFVDEVDKICSSAKNGSKHESFISATQSTLLKLIEGKAVKVPGQIFGEPPGTFLAVNTDKILFFFGGAFNGLSDIVADKVGVKSRSVGFRQSENTINYEMDKALKSYEIFSQATRDQMVDALIEYGMMSELAGRIPTIVPLKPLSKEELEKVLLHSQASPILKLSNIFKNAGLELKFTDEAVLELVEKAYQSASGTRALDSYAKFCVRDASFDLLTVNKKPSTTGVVTITKECIANPSAYEKNLKSIIAMPSNSISTSAYN
mgnify:CR=1 FL=1